MRQGSQSNKKELLGKFRADVLDVNDPDGRDRIRVSCPQATGNSTPLNWAESCLPPGFHTLPERGDKVWIEFEQGEIDKPLWCGILMTRNYYSRFKSPDVKDIVMVSKGKVHNIAEDDIKTETKGKHELEADSDVKTTTKTNISQTATGNVDFVSAATLTITDNNGSFSPP